MRAGEASADELLQAALDEVMLRGLLSPWQSSPLVRDAGHGPSLVSCPNVNGSLQGSHSRSLRVDYPG